MNKVAICYATMMSPLLAKAGMADEMQENP
jgi:hypothetical protein